MANFVNAFIFDMAPSYKDSPKGTTLTLTNMFPDVAV